MSRLGQSLQRRLNHQKVSFNVGPKHFIQVGFGHIRQFHVGEDSGVGADNVQTTVASNRRFHKRFTVCRAGHVAQNIGNFGSICSDAREFFSGTLCRGFVAARDDDGTAGFCKTAGDAFADSLCPARHKHAATRDIKH